MSVGLAVWTATGAVWVGWLVVTGLARPLPGIERVVRGVLQSWLGRLLALAAWAEAGWHLFGQRP